MRRQREAEEERKREEQRKLEEEKRREEEFAETIAEWRLSRDIRAYVEEAHRLVAAANLSITDGGGLDVHLRWALAYAERLDPQTGLREEIARVIAEGHNRDGGADPSKANLAPGELARCDPAAGASGDAARNPPADALGPPEEQPAA